MTFIETFTEKESGKRYGETYVLYERESNLLLICREESKKEDVQKAVNYMPEDMFADMAEALDTKSGIVAYVYQAEGTTSDVTLFNRNNINTAKDVFQAVSKLDLSKKYIDFTSSAEDVKDFVDAVTALSESDNQVTL